MSRKRKERGLSRVTTTSRKRSRRGRRMLASPGTASLSRGTAESRYKTARKTRGRKKALHVTLAIVAVVLISCAGVAWAYFNSINSRLTDGISDSLRSTLTSTDAGEPFYMLLLGVDNNTDRENSANSDSIMLVRVDPQNKKVTLVSIHRDTLVDLGTHGKQKINAAYAIGGASYATQVISEFAGVSISHYAELDMDGFTSVVDQLGGITVDVPVTVDDTSGTGCYIAAGEQTLNGAQATALCRARHAYDAYGDGDLYRAANQRMVIAAIVKKILASDPVTMASTISTLAGYVSTDMDVTSILNLASEMRGLNVDSDVYSGMEPTTSEYVNSTWYEICDTTAWKTMMQRVDEGLTPYESTSDDPTYGVAGSVGSESSSSTTTSSTTSSSTTSADSLDYSGTVEVLNGSGVSGLASRVASSLTSLGFDASSGNASSFSHATTIIVYNGDSHEAQAEAASQALGGEITVEANDGSYDTSPDVVVVLGTDQS